MRIRAVSLGNPWRRKEIASRFSVQPDHLPLCGFIFVMTALSGRQRRILQHLASPGLIRIVTDAPQGMIMAPGPGCHAETVFPESDVPDHGLREALDRVRAFLYHRRKPVWRWGERELDFSGGPFIMGILNVTPDSFSDGGRYFSSEKAVEHGLMMMEQGARIIDVGGESTRPGADPVPLDEELSRVIPVIEELRKVPDALISIDSYKSAVARAALDAGADMVNDISGALFDARMAGVVRDYGCPLIVMHIRGTPRDMQRDPVYDDVLEEIYGHFESRLQALRGEGVTRLAVDPGIGFGKRLQDNLELIRGLEDFSFLGVPVVIGTSRKSFIGRILDKAADERLSGTLATVCSSVWHGADIVRVHDVAAVRDAVSMIRAIEEGYPAGSREPAPDVTKVI